MADILDYEPLDGSRDEAILDRLDQIAVNTGGASGSSDVNKFGYNSDVDTGGEEIVGAFGGAYDPNTRVITTAQTFTITYTNTTDGSTATGVRTLGITYLDENYAEQTAVHVLGSSGSDVTSFTGFGINRVYCYTFGGDSFAGSDITVTATTDGTTQAIIPAGESVTQQCLYHTPIDKTLGISHIDINTTKISGGGGSPLVTVKLYTFSRITNGIYKVAEYIIDTATTNSIVVDYPEKIQFTGREVIYLTAETDVNNTKVYARFSGTLTDS